jgi:hypothetical protein
MKDKSLNNISYYSAYSLIIYFELLGIFNLIFPAKITQVLNLQTSVEISWLYLILGGLLISQIYRISKSLFLKLIDTFIIILFVLSVIYPIFCVLGLLIFNLSYLFFMLIHFLLILHLLYDKNK